MKRIGPIILVLLIGLISCNNSFQKTRKHAHRKFVPTGELNVQRDEPIVVEKINSDWVAVSHRKPMLVTKTINIIHSTGYQPSLHRKGPLLTRKKITFSNRANHLLGSTSDRIGRPTLNILAFIFTMTYFLMAAGFILGILGIAMNRPLRGLGIASICIFVAGMIAFALVIFLVVL